MKQPTDFSVYRYVSQDLQVGGRSQETDQSAIEPATDSTQNPALSRLQRGQ
jgi:hypothetical protein